MTARLRGRSLARRTALVALATALLLLALAAAAPLLVDRDALARRIEAEMAAAIGLPVQLDAVTELALLPVPHAVLGPLQVLPPAGAGDRGAAQPLAVARSLRLELAWPALLLGKAEPILLRAEGLDLVRGSQLGLPPPRWLATLAVPAPQLRDATLILDYPPGAPRLRWPLREHESSFSKAADAPLLTPADPQPGPLRITAALRLERVAPRLAGNLRLDAEADLTALPALSIAPVQLTLGELDLGELRDLSVRLTAEQARRSADGHWRLQGLALTAGALRIDGDLDLFRAADGRLAGAGRLALAPLDLRGWLAAHGARSLPGQAQMLSCITADGLFRLADAQLSIGPVALRADTTSAALAATIGLGPRPRAAVAAHLDRLDLDPYLVPAPVSTPLPAPVPAGPVAAETAIGAEPCTRPADRIAGAAPAAPSPPALPADDTELRLELAAQVLRAGRLTYGELAAATTQRGPSTTADLDAAAFYGGTLHALIEHRLQPGAPPRQTLRAEAQGIDIDDLLTDLQGSPQVTGSADLMADLAATGADPEAIRRDLSGAVRIDLRDGRIAALDQAAASFGPPLAALGLPVTPDSLAFARLKAGAEAEAGVFTIVDLDGRTRLFRLGGDGRVDAGTETLDLALTATLVQPADGPDLKGLAGIEVPIRVEGSIRAPAVQPDLAQAMAEVARRSARRHLSQDGNLLQQIEEATGVKGLEQGLRGLFGF